MSNAQEIDDDVYAFSRERHEYTINKHIVPSVTQALRRAGFIRFFCSIDKLKTAMQRGRDVHLICADIDKGAPDYWSDGEFAGYAAAWLKFVKDFDFKALHVEERVYSQVFGYAGTVDVVGYIFSSSRERSLLTVVERKTGGKAKWHREQVSGYWLALSSLGIDSMRARRLLVYLRPNGNFTAEYVDDQKSITTFQSALYCAKIRSERGLYFDDENFDCVLLGDSATGRAIDQAMKFLDD